MKFRVLIIDDNVALTTLLAKALARFGYDPVTENNPLLAVNTVRHYRPDLILLDVMMPERDGGRILADLRNDLSLRHIPVVLLTGIAREAQALANTGGIVSQILSKPVQLEELIALIDSTIKTSLNENSPELADSTAPLAPAPTFAELPDFDQEFSRITKQANPASRGSAEVSPFAARFPPRESLPLLSGNGAGFFSFPGRTDGNESRPD